MGGEDTLRNVMVHCVVAKEFGTNIIHLEDGAEDESWSGRDLSGCREMTARCGMQTVLCEADRHRCWRWGEGGARAGGREDAGRRMRGTTATTARTTASLARTPTPPSSHVILSQSHRRPTHWTQPRRTPDAPARRPTHTANHAYARRPPSLSTSPATATTLREMPL